MLRRFERLKSAVLQGLDAIERNSRLQGQLIGDLLDYAGIRFGKLRVVRELVNPHVPLRAALADGQATANERGIKRNRPRCSFHCSSARSSESSSPLQASGIGDSSLLHNADLLQVKDDADTRAFLKRILEEAGAHVISVAGADAAEQALEFHTPDLLISDIEMAGRDRYELIRSERANGLSVDRLLAVALTAFVRDGDRQSAFAAGFQLHLPKPVDPDELVRKVSSLLKAGPVR